MERKLTLIIKNGTGDGRTGLAHGITGVYANVSKVTWEMIVLYLYVPTALHLGELAPVQVIVFVEKDITIAITQ